MNTTLTNPVLAEIAIKLGFADQYLNAKENLRVNFIRFKKDLPFSQRLNDWLKGWYSDHKDKFIFSEVDYFTEMTPKQAFEKMKNDYAATGKIVIWTGESEGTIFGDPVYNHIFRAWHDLTHVLLNQDFGFAGESVVGTAQVHQLPSDWIFEQQLITAEILGQNQYYRQHKAFLIDQRKFAYDYLQNPVTAIHTRQQKGFIDLRKN
jgi:hypothetical protein